MVYTRTLYTVVDPRWQGVREVTKKSNFLAGTCSNKFHLFRWTQDRRSKRYNQREIPEPLGNTSVLVGAPGLIIAIIIIIINFSYIYKRETFEILNEFSSFFQIFPYSSIFPQTPFPFGSRTHEFLLSRTRGKGVRIDTTTSIDF